jgi:adenylate cyclase
MAQLLLGLCIPPLLANHVTNTCIAFAEFGMDKGYAQVLYAFWIDSPFFARVQLALLVVACSCMGATASGSGCA